MMGYVCEWSLVAVNAGGLTGANRGFTAPVLEEHHSLLNVKHKKVVKIIIPSSFKQQHLSKHILL